MPNTLSAAPRVTSAARPKTRVANVFTSAVHPAQVMQPAASRRLRLTPARDGRRGAMVESLESREMLSVSQNAAGWTVVTPSAGSRVVYVSSSQGNDRNSGLSPSSPLRTIAKGETLIRNGSSDELLLKRGDTWNESLGFWGKQGLSPQAPVVIGAYGTGARPTLLTGNNSAFIAGGAPLYNVDIIGLKMFPNARSGNGPDGISVDSKVSNFLLEDCDIQGYRNNIVFQKYYGAMSNVTIRRSNISNSWSANAHSEGLFADGVSGLVLQDNVFNHNGWNTAAGGWMTIFNHDVYVYATCSNFVATNNIFANASNFGLEARAGGIVDNNIFYNDADGLEFGMVDGASVTPGGVSGEVIGNYFTGSHMIGSQTYGGALLLGNINSRGVRVTSNIFANNTVGKVAAIQLGVGAGNSNGNAAVGLNNVSITNNIVYNWYEGLWIQPGLRVGGTGPWALNGLNITGNNFQQVKSNSTGAVYPGMYNVRPSAAGGFSNPNRSVGSYATTIGLGSSADAFFAAAGAQSSQNWKTSLTAAGALGYIRGGF